MCVRRLLRSNTVCGLASRILPLHANDHGPTIAKPGANVLWHKYGLDVYKNPVFRFSRLGTTPPPALIESRKKNSHYLALESRIIRRWRGPKGSWTNGAPALKMFVYRSRGTALLQIGDIAHHRT